MENYVIKHKERTIMEQNMKKGKRWLQNNEPRKYHPHEQEHKAINLLLEEDEQKQQQYHFESWSALPLAHQLKYKNQYQNRAKIYSIRKMEEKTSLKQYQQYKAYYQESSIDRSDNQDPYLQPQHQPQYHQPEHQIREQLKNKSNFTFYQNKKIFPQHQNHSSALSFYKKDKYMPKISEEKLKNIEIYSKIKELNQNPEDISNEYFSKFETNGIVYFKDNKAQSIRALLKQMKVQQEKHRYINLGSTNEKQFIHEYVDQGEERSRYEANFLVSGSDQKEKQFTKYRKFIPFKEDEGLLYAKMFKNESVWIKRFKESTIKKRYSESLKSRTVKPLKLID